MKKQIIFKNLEKYNITPNTISNGTLYTTEVYIENLKEDQNRLIRIYLPSNYDFNDSSKRFPVIYMMDGKNLFDKYTSFAGEWEVDEVIEKRIQNNQQSFIVVGIDSSKSDMGRVQEMLPSSKYLTSIDDLPNTLSSYGDILGDFIVNKIKPAIDEIFFTQPSKENTIIAGSSMGGLFAFYMGLKYKNIFDTSFCFSPAFCLYQEEEYIKELTNYQIDINQLNNIYLLVGDIEYENQFVSLTQKTYEILLNKNINKNKIKYVHDLNGIHHESFWNKYLNDAFDFYQNNKN